MFMAITVQALVVDELTSASSFAALRLTQIGSVGRPKQRTISVRKLKLSTESQPKCLPHAHMIEILYGP